MFSNQLLISLLLWINILYVSATPTQRQPLTTTGPPLFNGVPLVHFRLCCINFIRVRGICVECPPGKYGTNCTYNCPDNNYGILCQQRCNCLHGFSCSSIYGCVPLRIDEVCPEGKTGTNCTKNCDPGYYGINCEKKCSCEAEQYCNSEKGCRDIIGSGRNCSSCGTEKAKIESCVTKNTKGAKEATIWNRIEKLFENKKFLGVVIGCLVCFTVIATFGIAMRSRERILEKERQERITIQSRSLNGRQNFYSNDSSTMTRTDTVNTGRTQIENSDIDSNYAFLRESAVITNPTSQDVRISPSGKSGNRDDIDTPGSRSRFGKTFKGAACTTKNQEKLCSDTLDTSEKPSGYHHLQREFSQKKPRNIPGYTDTQPYLQRMQNQYSYNVLELKAENIASASEKDIILENYDQTEPHLPKDTHVDQGMHCKGAECSATLAKKSKSYSHARGLQMSEIHEEKEMKQANKAYSLQRTIHPEMINEEKKQKRKSKKKKQNSLEKQLSKEKHCESNTYTKSIDLRRKDSTAKGVTGNVTIISRLSTLWSAKTKASSVSTHAENRLEEEPAEIDSFDCDMDTQGNDISGTDADENSFGHFDDGPRQEYSLVRHMEPLSRNKPSNVSMSNRRELGYSVVQKQPSDGNSTGQSKAFAPIKYRLSYMDDLALPPYPSSEGNIEGIPNDEGQLPYSTVNNSYITHEQETAESYRLLPTHPGVENNFNESVQGGDKSNLSWNDKNQNDNPLVEEVPSSTIDRDRKSYSLVRKARNSRDTSAADEPKYERKASQVRPKQKTADANSGQVTIISRLSSLFNAHYKPGGKLTSDQAATDKNKSSGIPDHEYYKLEK